MYEIKTILKIYHKKCKNEKNVEKQTKILKILNNK